MSERLRAQARLHAFPGLRESGQLVRSAQEHVALVRAMAQGESDAVKDIVGHHISYALAVLAQMAPLEHD